MIGSQLDGRYRIIRKLGEGGMGEVYLAEHVALRRMEAMKILLPALAATPELVSRFRREARATNRLEHPNIISVFDFGRLPDGRFYLTTEYAEGEDLSAILEGERAMSIERALPILAQLADAIDHAHSRGVIHRDIKPHNLKLTRRHGRRDFLKVLDFGIAKITSPDYEDSLGSTRKGTMLGSPSYMAPEQFTGEGKDPRVDIYGFGCVAFAMVAGRPPFTGKAFDIMSGHLTQPPPRPSRGAGPGTVCEAFDELVLQCLAKDPADRFQTAGEIARLLRELPEYAEPAPSADAHDDVETHVELSRAADTMATGPTSAVSREQATLLANAALQALALLLIDLGCQDVQLLIGLGNISCKANELERLASAVDVPAELESVEVELEGLLDGLYALVQDVLPPFREHPQVAELADRLDRARETQVITRNFKGRG